MDNILTRWPHADRKCGADSRSLFCALCNDCPATLVYINGLDCIAIVASTAAQEQENVYVLVAEDLVDQKKRTKKKKKTKVKEKTRETEKTKKNRRSGRRRRGRKKQEEDNYLRLY